MSRIRRSFLLTTISLVCVVLVIILLNVGYSYEVGPISCLFFSIICFLYFALDLFIKDKNDKK